MLVLKQSASPQYDTRILIDTARHVILSIESRNKNKVTGTTTFGDFVEAAGSWWARRVETTDEDGKRSSLTTQTVNTLAANALDERIKTELAGRPQVQLLRLPVPSVSAAKKALAAGKADFEDQLVLLLHFHRSQQWPRVFDHLQQAEKLAAGKPGTRWLRSALLYDSRRYEELRQRYQLDAARLAKGDAADAYFLAGHIVGQSSGVLQANEMLALLDVLRPLYDKQPAHVHAGKHWTQQRVAYLGQAGRSDEALRLQKQLAADYPHDYGLQQQYAQALAGVGDYPAAYAWLARVLVKEANWREDEAESLRSVHARLLEQQGRYPDLVAFLARWVEESPERPSAYEQYLSALIKADQVEKADAHARRWLKEAQVPGEPAPAVASRLSAAIHWMQGNAYQLYTNRIEERWLAPLAEAVLYFLRQPTQTRIAEQILGSQQFQHTDEARTLRKAFAVILSGEIDKLPAEQVRLLVDWVQADDAAPAAWDRVIGTLRQRWTNEPDADTRHVLGQALLSMLSRHGGLKEPLAFLRLQRQDGPEGRRTEYTNQLFNRLVDQPWTAEFETEAFTLFDKLSGAAERGERLFAAVAALHRLTDKLLESRFAAHMTSLEHAEKLTRTELQKKQEENRRLAREGLGDRLRTEAAKHPRELASWLVAESVYLDLLLDRNLKQAAAAAWEVAGPTPPANPQAGAEPSIERALEEILRERYLVTLMNLAARKARSRRSLNDCSSISMRAFALMSMRVAGSSRNIGCSSRWIVQRTWNGRSPIGQSRTTRTAVGVSRSATCWPSKVASPKRSANSKPWRRPMN